MKPGDFKTVGEVLIVGLAMFVWMIFAMTGIKL